MILYSITLVITSNHTRERDTFDYINKLLAERPNGILSLSSNECVSLMEIHKFQKCGFDLPVQEDN